MLSRESTTAYKGIAILTVLHSHLYGVTKIGFKPLAPLAGVGVALFLILSAYGLNESWKNAAAKNEARNRRIWWRKRFVAVWIPYIIVQLCAYWSTHVFQITDFVLDLTLIKPLYIYGWYMQYLFLWYVVFYFVKRVPFLDKRHILIFSCVSLFFFFTQQKIKSEQSFSFLIGILLSEKKSFRDALFTFRTGIVLTAGGVFFRVLQQIPEIHTSSPCLINFIQMGVNLPSALGFAALGWELIKRNYFGYIGFVLGAIGLVSYELYLVHGYVLPLAPKSLVGVTIFLVASATFATVLHLIIARLNPFCKRLLRMSS